MLATEPNDVTFSDAPGLGQTLDVPLTSIDLRAMVVETMASRRQQLERHGHTLSLDLGHEPLCVDADPGCLSQMLSNLVDNAIDCSARGGHIVVSLCRTAGDITLTVHNSGHGSSVRAPSSGPGLGSRFGTLPAGARRPPDGRGSAHPTASRD
jgi:light-regulated signal transduction histidine kinase (bacteriophytochrome)